MNYIWRKKDPWILNSENFFFASNLESREGPIKSHFVFIHHLLVLSLLSICQVTIPSLASVYNEYALKSQFDTSIYLQVIIYIVSGCIVECFGLDFNYISLLDVFPDNRAYLLKHVVLVLLIKYVLPSIVSDICFKQLLSSNHDIDSVLNLFIYFLFYTVEPVPLRIWCYIQFPWHCRNCYFQRYGNVQIFKNRAYLPVDCMRLISLECFKNFHSLTT